MIDKTQKIKDGLEVAKQGTQIGKVIAPGKVGRGIDKAETVIDVATESLSIFEKFRSLFKKKKK